MKAITENQKETLRFIAEFTEKNGYQPTYANIADNYGITISAAYGRVQGLKIKNMVGACGGYRGIAISPEGQNALCNRA